MAALAVNGIQADRIEVKPPTPGEYLLIKNWDTSYGQPAFFTPPYEWKLWFNDTNDLMYPVVNGNVFGQWENLGGLKGQNQNNPTEKIFQNHFLVRVNSEYYDPSYGKKHADASAFQTSALSGYAQFTSGTDPDPQDPNKMYRIFKARTGGAAPDFTVHSSN